MKVSYLRAAQLSHAGYMVAIGSQSFVTDQMLLCCIVLMGSIRMKVAYKSGTSQTLFVSIM